MKKRFYILLGIAFLMTACGGALDGGNLIGPAGGSVFYDKGSYSNNWRYLECAPENAGTGSWGEAQQLCGDYSYGGYDDWRWPTIDELKELMGGGHGLKYDNEFYWSSSEEDGPSAWGIEVKEGKVQDPAAYDKNSKYVAWPVRQF
jgi:hypothetical protein